MLIKIFELYPPTKILFLKTFTDRLYIAIENQLNEVSLNGEPLAEQDGVSILICKKAMAKLKNYVSTYQFKNIDEEIHFFQ